MGFRPARRESEELTEKEFKESANKTSEEIEKGKIKNFNLRLSQEELELLKKEALRNSRSMQQHIKHLLRNSCEPKKDL